ncbi:glycosyltransferase [Mycobacterium sp. NBC_00419]|uniref:glycosyltransferase n=1 Tax=Mycobacterium sp. NBC_00419 TaxID=2975989 RepID=UPI002E221982
MRVCFFITSLGDGGAQRQCIALLNELQKIRGVEVHLILAGRGEHDHDLDVSGLHLHRIAVASFRNPLLLAFVIRTLIRVRPDVLISWLQGADIWSYVATRVVRGVPWIMTERGSAYPDEAIYNLRKRLGRKADAIVANSRQGREMWELLAPSVPVLQISNIPLRQPDSAASTPRRMDSIECLYVGRLAPPKNVGAMAAAFAAFADENPHAQLVVAGQGPDEPAILEAMLTRGVGGRAVLLGFRNDVPQLMSQSRLLLSLSEHEGMPNVIMEAVAAGLPAVVSDIPQHRALLGDSYPFYVPLEASPEKAGAVIAKAWAAPPDANLYAHALRVLSGMTPDVVVEEFLKAFTRVIDGRTSR